MEHDEEVSLPVQIDPQEIYKQDRAQVDIQVATAHAYPRNITRATDDALAIVTMDEETAATCSYTVPRGTKSIIGPSVHLAKIVAQTWGNLRVQAKVIAIEDKQIVSQSTAWDLQNNLAIQIEVRRSIVSKSKGRFSDDMVTVTGNAANSIALRNAILSVIPKAVIDKVYKAAKQKITGDVSDENKLKAARKKIIDMLVDRYRVTEKDVLDAIGRVSREHITPDDLVILTGIGTAIKDGDTTIEEAFGKTKPGGEAPSKTEKEAERILLLIRDASTLDELKKYEKEAKTDELKKAYGEQKKILEALKL